MDTRRRPRRHYAGLALFAVAALLSGCGKTMPADEPQHDQRTEAQREKDCADPQWKAANLGLWYNLCQGTRYQ